MAKWGEGDPRWIVEERPDATNVNNWHWVEKNATGWSKDKLTELLTGLTIDDDGVFCELKEITSIDGEASANNRKAKLIFFYEWVIKGTWSGKIKAGSTKHSGKFEIPNLSEEHSPEEVDVTFTLNKEETDEGYKIKQVLNKKGTELIREKFAKYLSDLKQEFSQGIILPTKTGSGGGTKPQSCSAAVNNVTAEFKKASVTKPSTDVGVKIHTKKLVTKEEFCCRAADLYRVFTDKEMLHAFTGGPVTIEAEKGGHFSLMGGNITGDFIELIPEKKIVKRWRLKSWPDEHYSEVTIEFTEKGDKTVLNLIQTGVPDSEYETTLQGWKLNYWQRIMGVFGFGVGRLF